MTVQELIDELMKVQDKTLPVYDYTQWPVEKVEEIDSHEIEKNVSHYVYLTM